MRVSGRQRRAYLMLARVRRSLRSANAAITRGAEQLGITMQEQSFLLALAAYGGISVPLADVREELEMDQGSASILLRRLVAKRLVERATADDRRALDISLTSRGWSIFQRSIETIRHEMQRAEHRGELASLDSELSAYLAYYLSRSVSRTRPAHRPRV